MQVVQVELQVKQLLQDQIQFLVQLHLMAEVVVVTTLVMVETVDQVEEVMDLDHLAVRVIHLQ